jgi:hypothetical protein
MLRLNSSDPTVVSLRFAAVALFLVNCAPTAEPVGPQGGSTGNGGDTSAKGGTSSGSGGSSTGNGGTTATGNGGASTSMGGASTSMGGAATAKGGGTSSNGGATTAANGGATTGSGGTTATGAGGATTTGTGGATSTTCPPYAGTIAKDSVIFTDGFGKAKTGTWSGYAFTYAYEKGGTILPDSSKGTSCFKGAKMCASGSIPASDEAGAAIGWNIGQMMGSTTNTPVALTGSVKVTAAGAAAGMRVNLQPATGEAYCYTLSAADVTAIAAGLSVPVASFKQYCYDTAKAVAYTTAAIGSIQVSIPGAMAGAKSFDLCLVDVEPG